MINHITHLEDLVLTHGSLGAMKIQNILWSIQNGSAHMMTKWDGAPSIFAGWDDHGFFVSTKSYLNKTPITYHSLVEINDSKMDDGLKDKMMFCLTYLEDVVPKGVVLQGDLMFCGNSAKKIGNIVRFHPNTIIYDMPSHWFKESWELGVVWHSWISKDGDISHPAFGRLLTTDKVFSIDPTLKYFGIEKDIVSNVKEKFNRLDMEYIDKISKSKASLILQRWYNHNLRNGFINLEDFCDQKFPNDTEERSLFFYKQGGYLPKLNSLITFQDSIRVAKQTIINSLESHSKVKCSVKNDDGLVPTAHEGYVVFGQSETLKIVDRAQFSRYNFDPNIHKGWNTPTRK